MWDINITLSLSLSHSVGYSKRLKSESGDDWLFCWSVQPVAERWLKSHPDPTRIHTPFLSFFLLLSFILVFSTLFGRRRRRILRAFLLVTSARCVADSVSLRPLTSAFASFSSLSLSLRPCIPLLRHIFLALPSHHREREKQTKNVRRWNNKKKEQELLQCCCASDSYSTQRTWLSVLFHFLTLFILPDGWDRAWLAGPVIQADVLICQSETWLYQ